MEISELDRVAADIAGGLFDTYHLRLKYEPVEQRRESIINEIVIVSPGLILEERVYLEGAVEKRIEQLIDTAFKGFEADLKHEAANELELLRIRCADSRPVDTSGIHLYEMQKALGYIKRS